MPNAITNYQSPQDYARQRAIATLRSVQAPPPPPVDISSAYGAPGAAPPPVQGPMFPDAVAAEEKKLGHRLSSDELDIVSKNFVDRTVAPGIQAQKGATQQSMATGLQEYDSYYRPFKADYLAQQAASGAAAAAPNRSTMDHAEGFGLAAASGVPKLYQLAALAASVPAIGYDKVKSIVTGQDTTAAQDYMFKYGVDPGKNAADSLDKAAEAKSPTGALLGNVAFQLAMAVATKGAGTGVDTASLATNTAKILNVLKSGLPAGVGAQLPASVGTANRAIDSGGNAGAQFATDQLVGSGLNALPAGIATKVGKRFSLPNVLKRSLTGAPIGAGSAYAQQAALHLVDPGHTAAPDMKTALMGAVLGGGLAGLAGGHNAPKLDPVGVQPDGSTVSRNPETGEVVVTPAGETPPGAPPAGEAAAKTKAPLAEGAGLGEKDLQDAIGNAMEAAVRSRALKAEIGKAPTAEAAYALAARQAEKAAGKSWADMTSVQRLQATRSVSEVMADSTKHDMKAVADAADVNNSLAQAATAKAAAEAATPPVEPAPPVTPTEVAPGDLGKVVDAVGGQAPPVGGAPAAVAPVVTAKPAPKRPAAAKAVAKTAMDEAGQSTGPLKTGAAPETVAAALASDGPTPPIVTSSTPKFGNRAVTFASWVDKVAYMVRKPNALKDKKFLKLLQDKLGWTPEQARAHGEAVNAQVKDAANSQKGTLQIKAVARASEAPRAEPVAPAAPVEPVAPPVVEAPPMPVVPKVGLKARPKTKATKAAKANPLKKAPSANEQAIAKGKHDTAEGNVAAAEAVLKRKTTAENKARLAKAKAAEEAAAKELADVKAREAEAKAAEVPPPKKAEAPVAQEPAGAESQPEASPSKPQESASPSESGADAVARITKGSLGDSISKDMADAIEGSRMGERGDLNQLLREHADVLTDAERTALREAGKKPTTADTVHASKAKTAEANKKARADKAEAEGRDGVNETVDTPEQARARVEEVLKKDPVEPPAKAGPSAQTIANAKALIAALEDAVKSNSIDGPMAKFAIWALRNNPGLARGLAITGLQRVARGGSQTVGTYSQFQQLVKILLNSHLPVRALVHEIMHHSERMLPPDIRMAVSKEHAAQTASELKKLEAIINSGKATASDRVALGYMILADRMARGQGTHAQRTAMAALMDKALGQMGPDTTKYYRYYNASEYWAETASMAMEGRYLDKGMTERVLDWFKELIGHIKAVSGLGKDSAVLRALNDLADTSGEFQSEGMIRQINKETGAIGDPNVNFQSAEDTVENMVGSTITKPPKEVAKALRGNLVRDSMSYIVESAMNNHVAFDKINELFAQLGKKIPEALDPYLAAVRRPSRAAHYIAEDIADYRTPVEAWIRARVHKFGNNEVDAMTNIGNFINDWHLMTERQPQRWRENVPLENGMGLDRQEILADLDANKITSADAEAQLKKMVEDHASIPLDAWSDSKTWSDMPGDISAKRADIQKRLTALAGKGVDANSLKELNTLLQRARDRARANNIEAGKVGAKDPWVDFYNYKWWVPEKGGTIAGKEGESFTGATLHQVSREFKQAEGVHTAELHNGVLQLFNDLAQSAHNRANTEFTGKLFDLLELHPDVFKHTVTSYKGAPRGGWTRLKDGKHFKNIPHNDKSFIHSEGAIQHVIELPADSQMLRGLQAIHTNYSISDWGGVAKGITATNALVKHASGGLLKDPHVENVIAKTTRWLALSKTMLNPFWQGSTAAVRNLSELPFTMAALRSAGLVDGMKLVATFYGKLISGGLKGGWAVGSRNIAELRALSKSDPDSFGAWAYSLMQEGGVTHFAQAFGTDVGKHSLTKALNPLTAKSAPGKAAQAYMQAATGWAELTEMIGRVAAYKALVARGHSRSTAAAMTKDLINFEQKGTFGKTMNDYHMFARMTMTGNDVLRRSFKTPTGEFDYNKLAKWVAVMSGASFTYTILSGMMMGNDEDGVSVLRKQNINTLTSHLMIPNGTNKPYMLSMGLGVPQMLGAPGVIAAMIVLGHIDAGEGVKALADVFQRNASVVEPVGTATDADWGDRMTAYTLGMTLPSAALPAVNLMTNTNSFGSSIYSKYDKPDKFQSDTGKGSTPKYWKDLATEMREVTGVDAHPETLRFMFTEYGGSAASDINNMALSTKQRESEGLTGNKLAKFSRLQSQDSDYYYNKELYRVGQGLNGAVQRYNHQLAEATREAKGNKAIANAATAQWLNNTPAVKKQVEAAKTLSKASATYRKGIAALRDGTQSPEGKVLARKRLDSALRQATDTAAKALDD